MEEMAWKLLFVIGIFYIFVPTFDVYSDVALITSLLQLEVTEYASVTNFARNIGIIMASVLVICTSFVVPHWLECEKGWRKRLITFPLVLLQLYPQYRAFRILWILFREKDSEKATIEKSWYERNIAHVGK